MKKISLVLVLILMLGVVACGKEPEVETNVDVEESQTEESQVDEATNEETSGTENLTEEQIVLRDGEMLYDAFIYSYSKAGDTVYIREYVGEGGDVVIPEEIDGLPVVYIAQAAFGECTDVTSIQIPDNVQSIAREAFTGCTNLKSVNIPEGVTILSYYVFEDCASLESVALPSTLVEIEEGAFEGCASLTSVVIPEGVVLRGYDMGIFDDCTSLKEVVLPTTTTVIPTYMFRNSGLTEFVIPAHITKVDSQAFVGCDELKKLTVPSGADFDMFMLYDTGVTIYGEAGSKVEKEAASHGLTFVAIE